MGLNVPCFSHGSLLEEGGDVLTFEGSDKRCDWKTALRVHSPKFYWKVFLLDMSQLLFLYISIFGTDVRHHNVASRLLQKLTWALQMHSSMGTSQSWIRTMVF